MISPSYEEFIALKPYIVVRPNGTIHFKKGANQFYTKKFARTTPERQITWQEFQVYYSAILSIITGISNNNVYTTGED